MNGSPRARAWLVGVLAPLLVCCASSTRPAADVALEELAQSGGWQRAEIRGMSVYSNATAERTRLALVKLSRFVDLIEVLGGTSFRLDRPVKVFLFARMSQWERVADPGYLGHAWDRPEGYQLAMSLEPYAYDVLFHELVHLTL